MSLKYYHVENEQSVFDLVITLYSSSEFLYRFMSDNQDKLVDGVETRLFPGMTVSYDTDFTNLFVKSPATYDEAIILGTQPSFVLGVSWSSYELYSGYTVSTLIIDHPFGLDIEYDFTPATASDPSLGFDVSDQYVMAWSPTTDKINATNNGSSLFTVTALDRGTIFHTDTIYVENQRDYNEVDFRHEQIPNSIRNRGMTYAMFHNMRDDQGLYSINNSDTDDFMWIDSVYAPIPLNVVTPGMMDLGFTNPINSRIGASYSNSPFLATASTPDGWLHITFQNQIPDAGPLIVGVGNFIEMTYFGSTVSVTSPAGSVYNYVVGDDIKFNGSQFMNLDLFWSTDDTQIKLIVNGKVTTVDDGVNYQVDGLKSFNFGSGTGDTSVYVRNVDPILFPGFSGMRGRLDDIWLIGTTLAGYTFNNPILIDACREYLNEKFP